MHKIVVEGNELSRTPLIMRELVFNEGEYLTSNGLAQSLKNLRTTGLFNSVDINIAKQDGLNIVKVKVKINLPV